MKLCTNKLGSHERLLGPPALSSWRASADHTVLLSKARLPRPHGISAFGAACPDAEHAPMAACNRLSSLRQHWHPPTSKGAAPPCKAPLEQPHAARAFASAFHKALEWHQGSVGLHVHDASPLDAQLACGGGAMVAARGNVWAPSAVDAVDQCWCREIWGIPAALSQWQLQFAFAPPSPAAAASEACRQRGGAHPHNCSARQPRSQLPVIGRQPCGFLALVCAAAPWRLAL